MSDKPIGTAFERLADGRRTDRDVDLATLFDAIESAKEAFIDELATYLDDHPKSPYDNVGQLLDDFAFMVRFETIWLYETDLRKDDRAGSKG